jgi:hypothetical protein
LYRLYHGTEQSYRDLARLVLEQPIIDNGDSWKAACVYFAGIAPLDHRDEITRLSPIFVAVIRTIQNR